MFHPNSVLCFLAIRCLLFRRQRLILPLFLRQDRLSTGICFLEPNEAQIEPDHEITEPLLAWRKLQLEQGEVMGASDPAAAQVVDPLVFARDEERFKGVSFFFPL